MQMAERRSSQEQKEPCKLLINPLFAPTKLNFESERYIRGARLRAQGSNSNRLNCFTSGETDFYYNIGGQYITLAGI